LSSSLSSTYGLLNPLFARKRPLNGLVISEDRNLFPDTVNVGYFAGRQAAVVDPDLHPADVKAMMNRMLGFAAGALACAGPRSADAASKNPATIAPSLSHLRCRCFICHLLVDECDAALRHVPKVEVIVVEG
jgi:hypothetical protein